MASTYLIKNRRRTEAVVGFIFSGLKAGGAFDEKIFAVSDFGGSVVCLSKMEKIVTACPTLVSHPIFQMIKRRAERCC